MTNVDEFFAEIAKTGQHPRMYSDTYIMLELVGHRLDRESERLWQEADAKGLTGYDITDYIEDNIKMENVLKTSAPYWDGGYCVCGQNGSGEMFSMRDPWGIRPAFWYMDDEILVVASERPAIQTALDLEYNQIHELMPGQAIIANKYGDVRFAQIIEPKSNKACSFERIYFSRGNDKDIYNERKALGRQLVEPILKAIDDDVEHTVFSFIPNTAEVAFYGMIEGFTDYLKHKKIKQILALDHKPSEEEIAAIETPQVRIEKVVLKDIKLRTFITESDSRNDLAAHVYDITYGSLKPYVDNLVVIDDSIVRGTTLKESIIRILDRLHPKKLVLVSSSPQVRYPDYYGIDMAKMSEFIAFRAAIELLKDRNKEQLIYRVYQKCKSQVNLPKEEMVNYVKEIYAPFTDEDISKKMAELLRSEEVTTPIEIVYQTIEGLHKACPNTPGDWYFSGDFPTLGGIRLLNQAFINYVEKIYLAK
jgi:amidophosphoribosyltransferase